MLALLLARFGAPKPSPASTVGGGSGLLAQTAVLGDATPSAALGEGGGTSV